MRIQEIIETIKTLSPTDRYHLRKLLKEQEEADKLAVFHQVLLSQGLVKEVKKSHGTATIERQLIEIKGKPVSGTIIEERNRRRSTIWIVVVLLNVMSRSWDPISYLTIRSIHIRCRGVCRVWLWWV